jgi:hypothetical protein
MGKEDVSEDSPKAGDSREVSCMSRNVAHSTD